VEQDQLERRRGERPVGADAIARDEREPNAEQQVDQRDDRNGRPPRRTVTQGAD